MCYTFNSIPIYITSSNWWQGCMYIAVNITMFRHINIGMAAHTLSRTLIARSRTWKVAEQHNHIINPQTMVAYVGMNIMELSGIMCIMICKPIINYTTNCNALTQNMDD